MAQSNGGLEKLWVSTARSEIRRSSRSGGALKPWGLPAAQGRLEPRQLEIIEVLMESLLHDGERSVQDEARTALEQLEDPVVVERLEALMNDGFLI